MERSIRIGLLRLTDTAPAIVAKERGFFARQEIEATLAIHPSWANIADLLSYGQLDAAIMPPPLAYGITLGLRGVGTAVIVPMNISLNGNAVTFARRLADDLGADADAMENGRRFARHITRTGERPRLAVVHTFSTHNLLLRYWLAAVGVDPERAVELVVIPPADVVDALAAGHIAGFCAGAPWGGVAARRGVGRTVALSSDIWQGHSEKCLAVRADWAERHPHVLTALVRALLGAAQPCDDPRETDGIARLLAPYLLVEPETIRASLAGARQSASGVDTSVFFAGAATFPWRSHALWYAREMKQWGYLPDDVEVPRLVDGLYRPDLYSAAAQAEGLSSPLSNGKTEGSHLSPWRTAGTMGEITMGPDGFCDGALFDPAGSS